MNKMGFEAVLLKAAPLFLGALYEAVCRTHPCYRRVCVPAVVSPMGDKIGYIVDGHLVTNEQMKEVLNDE